MGTKIPTLEMKSRLLAVMQHTIVLLHKGLFPGEDAEVVRKCMKTQITMFESLLEEWLKVPEAKEHPMYDYYTKCLEELSKLHPAPPPVAPDEDKEKNRVDAANEAAAAKRAKKKKA